MRDLDKGGCRPGSNYPAKLIGHRDARERVSAAVKKLH
jgi:hypothetical protein